MKDYGLYLSQLCGLDLLNLEEVTDGQKGDGHSTDAEHKNDQGWAVVDVASEVFYRVQQVHLHTDKHRLSLWIAFVSKQDVTL